MLGDPVEWSSPFSIVQCLMFKGSRVVSRMAILFCSMSNVHWVSGSHAEWPFFFICSILMPSQCPFIITCFCFSLLLGKYLYCIVMSIFVYYLLTYFVFLNLQKIAKKRKSVTSAICYSISHFGTDWVILVLFLSLHVLNSAL